MPLKEPANLSIRSRMLAALSASSKETDSDVKPAAESAKVSFGLSNFNQTFETSNYQFDTVGFVKV